MKFIAAVAFLIASVFGAPAPCSHAMGLDVADEAPQSKNVSHAHHGIDHRAHDVDHGDIANEHEDHGCTDGCDGGVGCEGCTITNSAISAVDEFHGSFISHSVLATTFADAVDKPTTLDPPPPRS